MKSYLEKIHKMTVALGVLMIVASLFFPADPLAEMRPLDYATVYAAPALGIVGIISSFVQKEYHWIIPNLLLILSFFIAMAMAFIGMALP
ncbi:hypothetical protein PEPCOX59622_01594 [Aedoeadaptatus coxii]|uniref:hypothetical protein n=1 Tax=Aedoeadaptatus coxii TaxID=755172 RepID=UPI001773E30F|nr:hypothetical protein [Peptoniphilus coxii]CAC9936172.1 hypothetical protein PEPCOX59622_01594 [Peptoniphilus coxii]